MKVNNKLINFILWLLPLAAIIFVFRQAVFGSGLFYDGDTILHFFPYFDFFAQTGGTRIMQSILSGFPAHVSEAGIWFYPINRLFLSIFSSFDAYRYLLITNLVLTYLFTYLFARKIEFNQLTSSLVALIFLFSGQLMLWSTTNANTNYFFILPAVLYFAEFVRRGQKPYLFLFLSGVFLGTGWLSGHVQFIVYIHIFVAVYYLFWVLRSKKLKLILIRAGQLFGVYGLSYLIGHQQIQAILGFSALSARAGGVSVKEFFIGAYWPQDLIHFLLPFWSNPIIKTGIANLYIGILPFIILLFAFFIYKRIKNTHFRFFFWTFTFSFVASIIYSPVGILLHFIPLMNAFRAIPRIMYIGSFGAAITVGYVLHYLINNYEEIKNSWQIYLTILRRIFIYFLAPIIIVVSLVQIFFYNQLQKVLRDYFISNIYPSTSGLPLEHYLNLIDQYLTSSLGQLSISDWQVQIFIVISILSFFLLRRLSQLKPQTIMVFVLLVTSLNVSAVYASHFNAVKKAELFEPSPVVEYINNHGGEEPFRIFSLFPGATEFNELSVRCNTTDVYEILALQKSLLTPNINALYGLETIDGYDNFMPRHYAEFLAYVGSERATAGELLIRQDISLEERVGLFTERKEILKSMNVKYVITSLPIEDDDFLEVFSSSVGKCATPVLVYELQGTWPRYFLTSKISILEDYSFESVVNELQSSIQQGKVVLEKDLTINNLETQEEIITPVTAIWEGDSVIFNISTDKDSLLFIGNTWLPGWQATIDGEPVEILRVNYIYMGISIQRGAHEVELKYTI